jgi:hypothetical protein
MRDVHIYMPYKYIYIYDMFMYVCKFLQFYEN